MMYTVTVTITVVANERVVANAYRLPIHAPILKVFQIDIRLYLTLGYKKEEV